MNQDNSSTKRLFAGLVVGIIFGLGIGIVLGLVYAYQINPVEWTNAAPEDLRVDYAAYYWELVAESYAVHGNTDLAERQLGTWDDPEKLQETLERARVESSPELQMVLESLSERIPDVSLQATPTPQETPAAEPTSPDEPGLLGDSLLPCLGVLLLLLVVVAAVALIIVRARRRRAETAAAEPVPEPVSAPWIEEVGGEMSPALGHFVTSYALGNDRYDESFSIETSAGEFLGECGVGISETIGEGDPDKVTAFEVWLFDKNDIRTVTKVLMSAYAFNDPDTRASLAPKGEAVLAQPQSTIVLETATLRLDVAVTEMTYGAPDELPSNSFFDRLTVELVARAKEEGEGGIL